VNDRPDLRELVGPEVSEDELTQLRRVDELLRTTPAPPEAPESLTAFVSRIPRQEPARRRRRLAAGLALAAALAAATFGIGIWVGGGSDSSVEVVEQIVLEPTAAASDARLVIDVFPVDPPGNWAMQADASGLEPLPEGGYYEVWLTQGKKLVSSCGRFVVGADGRAENVWLNAPYKFTRYDRWVVTAHVPGRTETPWLLDGPVVVPA
jgi:Anti-sigma-K factor rskA